MYVDYIGRANCCPLPEYFQSTFMADLEKTWTLVRYPVTRQEKSVFCALIRRSLVRLDSSLIGIKIRAQGPQGRLLP